MNCTFVPQNGISYDFHGLTLRSSEAYATSGVDSTGNKYRYVFNVCGVTNKPLGCNSKATAFRLSTSSSTECTAVGSKSLSSASFSPAGDIIDSSFGADLVYLSDSKCPQKPSSDLSFTVRLRCSRALDEGLKTDTNSDPCAPAVMMYSPLACPTQCAHTATSLCSDRGFCGFDSDAATARCYCYSGWSGAACDAEDSAAGRSVASSDSCGTGCTSLVVLIILFTLALAFVYALMCRVHRMSRMPVRFETDFSALYYASKNRKAEAAGSWLDGGADDGDEQSAEDKARYAEYSRHLSSEGALN